MWPQTQTYIYVLVVVLGTSTQPLQPKEININIYNGDCSDQAVTKTNSSVPSCDCDNTEWFTIQSTTGGDLVVDASDPHYLKLQHYTGSATQLWKFERANRPGTYYIINQKSRGTLDVYTDSKPFKPAITDKKSGSLNQQWVTNFNGRLRNVGTNLNLDVTSANFQPDTLIIVWNDNGNKAQEFVLVPK